MQVLPSKLRVQWHFLYHFLLFIHEATTAFFCCLVSCGRHFGSHKYHDLPLQWGIGRVDTLPRLSQNIMPDSFAKDDASIPPLLRERIERWGDALPKSQFQQYGPLNAVFSIKFPPFKFLVKPQALLREALDLSAEDTKAIQSGLLDPAMDTDAVEEIRTAVKQGRVSLDSNDAFVLNQKRYPDFVVTIYGQAMSTGPADRDGDAVRLVVEVGSVGHGDVRYMEALKKAQKKAITEQLLGYLDTLGPDGLRWKEKAIGIGIFGTEFVALQSKRDGTFTKTGKWRSLYSREFIEIIERLASK